MPFTLTFGGCSEQVWAKWSTQKFNIAWNRSVIQQQMPCQWCASWQWCDMLAVQRAFFSVPIILLWYATFHHIAISNKSRPQKDKISFVEGKLFSAGWALPRLQLLVSYCTAHLPPPTAAKVERSSNQSETISLLIHHVSRHTLTLRTKGASKTIVATFTRFANLVRCRQAWRYCMQWRTLKLVLGNYRVHQT